MYSDFIHPIEGSSTGHCQSQYTAPRLFTELTHTKMARNDLSHDSNTLQSGAVIRRRLQITTFSIRVSYTMEILLIANFSVSTNSTHSIRCDFDGHTVPILRVLCTYNAPYWMACSDNITLVNFCSCLLVRFDGVMALFLLAGRHRLTLNTKSTCSIAINSLCLRSIRLYCTSFALCECINIVNRKTFRLLLVVVSYIFPFISLFILLKVFLVFRFRSSWSCSFA